MRQPLYGERTPVGRLCLTVRPWEGSAMLSASRQGHRWFVVVCAIGVALVTNSVSVPAIANEPTDLRVITVTRRDGMVSMVVAVPAGSMASASAPGGLSVLAAANAPLTPAVTALSPSSTGVALLLHTAGADTASWQRAIGAAAELLRALDPATAATVVSTSGAVLAPLGTDRTAALAALGQPDAGGTVALTPALGAVATQLDGRGYIAPLVVVIDAAPTDPSA